jgi:hypothetical protein
MKPRILPCLVLLCALGAGPASAATVTAVPVTDTGVVLQTAQTGNADSTNTLDRGYTLTGPTLLTIVSTIGGTPTVTVNLLGSMNGTTFYNVSYALIATPTTDTIAAITITTATTGHYVLKNTTPWRYLKLNMSANTNVTLTTTAFPAFPQ